MSMEAQSFSRSFKNNAEILLFSVSEITARKFCEISEPEKIDPDSIRVIVHPEGVVMFWEPTEPNGIFKDYLIKFQDFGGENHLLLSLEVPPPHM